MNCFMATFTSTKHESNAREYIINLRGILIECISTFVFVLDTSLKCSLKYVAWVHSANTMLPKNIYPRKIIWHNTTIKISKKKLYLYWVVDSVIFVNRVEIIVNCICITKCSCNSHTSAAYFSRTVGFWNSKRSSLISCGKDSSLCIILLLVAKLTPDSLISCLWFTNPEESVPFLYQAD